MPIARDRDENVERVLEFEIKLADSAITGNRNQLLERRATMLKTLDNAILTDKTKLINMCVE